MLTQRMNRILCATLLAVCLTGALAALVAPPEALADDLDKKLAEAREALNEERFERAARLFAEVFEARNPEVEAGDALYWEAFARYRLQRTEQLKQAAELLQQQQEHFQQAAMAVEGEALAVRIAAELAERGEARAAREIQQWATQEDSREETRAAALQALMHMDRERAMPVLKKVIANRSAGNRELRRNAVFILCHEQDDETVDLLIDLLNEEDDPEFQGEIAMCLSRTGSDRAVDALIDLFRRTDDPEVSEMALLSIGRHGGDRVYDFLLELAGDRQKDPEVRAQALMALSMTDRDDDAADVIIGILGQEDDPEVLEMALIALSRLDSPRASEALLAAATRPDMDEDFQAMALHMAVRGGDVDIALLEQIYENASTRDLRVQVCHLLTRMDDEDAALEMLIRIVREEKDPEIRNDAMFWIGRFDSDRAAEFLLEIINEE